MVNGRGWWPAHACARPLVGTALALLLLPACGAVPADRGLAAALHVAASQFYAGDLEAIAAVGPPVISVLNILTTVQPGGLDAPDEPTFAATLSFSPALPLGPQVLVVRAVDGAGNFGAPALVPLTVVAAPLPGGTLVISLRWDTEADLDLHVVVPGGVEVWARNINSYQPPTPGTPVDPLAWQQGGILDVDSNAGCVIDGRRQEDVVWQAVPPAGTYLVRVDTASLCGVPDARWTVQVVADGAAIAASQGESLPSDTRFSKGLGSGVQALTFDVPGP
jgi:hypothetical protein